MMTTMKTLPDHVSLRRIATAIVASFAILTGGLATSASAAPPRETYADLARVEAKIMFETVVPYEGGAPGSEQIEGACEYRGRASVRATTADAVLKARLDVAAVGPCGEAMRQTARGGQAVLISARTDGRGKAVLEASAGEVVMSGGSTMVVAFIAFGSETSVLYVPGPESTISFGTFGTEASVLYDFPEEPGRDGFATFGAETSVLYDFPDQPGADGLVSFGHETTI